MTALTGPCRCLLGEFSYLLFRRIEDSSAAHLCSITPSFAVLFRHFFAVAFYSIWVMFTHPHPVLGADEKVTYVVPGWEAYPYLLLKSLQVVRPDISSTLASPSLTTTPLTVLDRLHRVRASDVVRGSMVVSAKGNGRV